MTASFDIRNSAFAIRPVPLKGNANFAWVQHVIHCIRCSLGEGGHLAPNGMAGFVLANTSMSTNLNSA